MTIEDYERENSDLRRMNNKLKDTLVKSLELIVDMARTIEERPKETK